VYRRRVGVLAGALIAGLAGLAVAGCAPAKTGAAAIMGNQRVTIATLDTETTKLSAAAKQYPGVVTLTQQQITQVTLSWLIRFQISDRLASQNGIAISNAQVDQALSAIFAQAQQAAAQNGVTNVSLTEVLASAGIAPDLRQQLGRYQAIADAYLMSLNGGKMPTASSPNLTSLETQYAQAQCVAAKSLRIKVNPQFGQLDYTHYAVVPGTDTLSRPSGPKATPSPIASAPSC
jgi:hypothetical protein